MKKTFLILASLAMLVSCTKTMEIVDEEKPSPEVTPSNVELKLNTIATPTKAIAEGREVPTDNGIRFYPRFFSDISSADYSGYNEIYTFGYDPDRLVWANYVGPVSPGVYPFDYNFSPLYWPAGERVFMDYTACSFSQYVCSRNTEGNRVLTVEPVKKNANRMDVNYRYSYLTGPFASSMILKGDELQEMKDQIQAMHQMGYVTDSELEVLDTISPEKYAEAVKLAMGDITTDDVEFLEGETEGEIKADAANQLNLAYWFFMNYAPRIYRFMQDDLLYAHDRSLKDSNHGEVRAVFNHSKVWVKVIVNNQTANDLYISGIRFDDVKSDGTLVIDNSKSAFEAYWDFPEEVASTVVGIEPLTEKLLDGADAGPGKGTQAVKGMLPDQYIIPTGCYGPALAVDTVYGGDKIQSLDCTYLNGGQRFDLGDADCMRMVGRLGGMMFPAQEPGMITIRYAFWKKWLENGGGEPASTAVYSLPMDEAVSETFTSSDTREISLNLPRQTWKMGKVYVYVLTIAENEITINPYVTEWEYADPIYGPALPENDPLSLTIDSYSNGGEY